MRTGRVSAVVVTGLLILGTAACGGPRAGLEVMTATPPAAPEVPGAVLRPGDRVGVEVWRQPEFTGEFTVNADGSLNHPLYREVVVAGLPLETVEQRIGGFLVPWVQEPQFSIEPQFRVSVGGEVRAPGVYFVPPSTTIADAITEAGGPTERAKNELELYRGGRGFYLDIRDPTAPVLANTVQSDDRIVMLRRREFSIFRDLIVPVLSATSIALQVIRLTR